MAFQIRRGTNAQRLGITPLQGELIYTTDTKALYVGDGTTAGGTAVDSGGGGGPDTNTTYTISAETATGGVNLRLTGSDASTDNVKLAEGSNITLTRTDANTITIAATGGGSLTAVQDDTMPTLGGNLDLNNFNINGTGDIDITGSITASSFTGDISNTNLQITDNRFISSGLTIEDDPTFQGIDLEDGYIRIHANRGKLEVRGIVDPLDPTGNNLVEYYTARGTISSPASVESGDTLGGRAVIAHDGVDFSLVGFEGYIVDPRYVPAPGSIKPIYAISMPNRFVPDDTIFKADSDGVLYSPVALQVEPLASPAARDLALPFGKVKAGQIIFLLDSTGFGGPPKLQVNTDDTTAGWVDLH